MTSYDPGPAVVLALLSRAHKLVLEDADEETRSELSYIIERLCGPKASDEVFVAAATWVVDDTAELRCLGCDILGQLGAGTEAALGFATRSVPLILAGLLDESVEALEHRLIALGDLFCLHAWDISRVAAFAGHDQPRVRLATAQALSQALACGAPAPMETLLDLMHDPDARVRNHSTRAVAGADADSSVIREHLARQADDSDPEVKQQATLGLASRGDARALELLEALLATAPPVELEAEHAAAPDGSRLITLLEGLSRQLPDDDSVSDALRRCRETLSRDEA